MEVSKILRASSMGRLTVAGPWDLGVRLADADVCGRIATTSPGVYGSNFVAIYLSILFFDDVDAPLSRWTRWWRLFWRQRSFRAA